MKSLLITFLFSFVSVLPAFAQDAELFDLQALPVVLKEKATVTDDYIRLGDLFSGLDDSADKKVIAPAPALGKEAVLTYEWLKKLAQTHKIAWEPANEKVSVKVRRAAAEISKEAVTQVILKELKAQGLPENAELTFQKGIFPVLVPVKSDWQLTPVSAEYTPTRQQFEAKLNLIVNSEKKQELQFAGKVKIFVFVPVAAQDLKAGRIITPDNVLMKRIAQESTVRAADSVKKEDLIGKEVKRSIRSGQMILANDVRTQVMVTKGKMITLNFTKGGIMLSAQGKALENGGLGDTVRVMNVQSKSVVQGTVTGPETVSIYTPGKQP
ncbi:MAG: flagellar basal body P-ring formation protein FlgA [Alphaproteobacteria bacterium]|nr:flagellar basal body P-ring formation protein FlgA [Alphaproteobacteria bacterium]